MKVSLNWVKQFTDINISTNELIELATERLGGIEGVTDLSKQYDGIVVAKVVSCAKHPNADKLSLCKIDDGSVNKDVERDENGYVQVVCGAKNVREDMLVAWIPPAAIVPASYGEKELFVLEARELRGELSNGMLASPRELGISNEHEGILEITENVKPGTLFKQLYDLNDTIIEIENKMLTHRPDGFGHLGVAREIAGIQHKAFKSPEWYLKNTISAGRNDRLSVSIDDASICPRYMAVLIENVEIKPSPIWLQSYLNRVGIKPINNIVDVTNYIMMLTAQPLHAFDFDKVAKSRKVSIEVRRPRNDEKLTLLDGKQITPHKDATLICNSNGPIALAGVMGGGNSEIDNNTKNIVLECATFDMYNIRRTSMIHGIFTDAVTRFTKGQPAKQLPAVLSKAIKMINETSGGQARGEVVDNYATKSEASKQNYIEITAKFINERLGSKLSDQQIINLLTNVEFQVHVASGPLSVTPPFWRTDIEIPEDVVEEVGRLHGFNQLPIKLQTRSIKPVNPNEARVLKSKIRSILSRCGANEVLGYSFVHGNLLKKAGQDPAKAFALRNALSPDLQYYRLSLLPSLLDKVHPNIKAGFDEFTLFEIGKSHNKPVNEKTNLPDEINLLEMIYASAKSKSGAAYYRVLRQVDQLLSSLNISYYIEPASGNDYKVQSELPYDKTRSAYIYYKSNKANEPIGIIGELSEAVIKAFKLPEYSAAATLYLDSQSFEPEYTNANKYKSLSRFQSVKQDVTFKINQDVGFLKLKNLIEAELLNADYEIVILPLGVYKKDDESTKNISFRITFTHKDRTLTTAEVNKIIEEVSWRVNQELGGVQV